jgi:hypothetical protein
MGRRLSGQSSRALGASARGRRARRAQPGKVERHQAGGVLGQAAAFRHHQRDRLARVGELALGQRIGIHMKPDGRDRQRQRNAVAGEQRAQIRVGQHRPHARQRARLGGIDAAQERMRERAAHEARMQQTRQFQIVDEPARAAQQLAILQPQHRAAAEAGGRVSGHALVPRAARSFSPRAGRRSG